MLARRAGFRGGFALQDITAVDAVPFNRFFFLKYIRGQKIGDQFAIPGFMMPFDLGRLSNDRATSAKPSDFAVAAKSE